MSNLENPCRHCIQTSSLNLNAALLFAYNTNTSLRLHPMADSSWDCCTPGHPHTLCTPSWMDRERTPPLCSSLTLSFKAARPKQHQTHLHDSKTKSEPRDTRRMFALLTLSPLLSFILSMCVVVVLGGKCDYFYPQRDRI